MLPLLLILAAVPDWVPARWHSSDVKTLELLNQTPVNCLLLERSEWSPGFAKAAKEHGIATLGVVRPSADALDQARKPTTLGMDGVVLEGDFDATVIKALLDSKIPTVELPSRARMRLDDPTLLVYGSDQGLWPGIQVEDNGSAKSAPSGAPWIDTNTGFLRFMRASTDKPVWIANIPPANMLVTAQRYIQAIADAEITGARWVVAFDDDFNKRLLAREPRALADWKRITAALSFYESHKEWRAMRPHGQLALIQDAGSGALLSGSVLDMIAVKNAPVQPVPTPKLNNEAMKDAKMAVDVDPSALSAAQKEVLKSFTRAGGTLLSAPPGWTFPMPKDGSITVAKDDFKKLDEIWKEVNGMVGHTNLGARLFNVSSMLSNLVAPAGGKQIVLELVNYSDFPVESITAQVLGAYKHARLYVPGAAPKDLPVYEVEGGTGVDIDKLDVIGTIILE